MQHNNDPQEPVIEVHPPNRPMAMLQLGVPEKSHALLPKLEPSGHYPQKEDKRLM